MATHVTINVCRACYHGETGDTDHLATMLEQYAIAQALVMMHGRDRGLRLYAEKGGVVHGPPEWLREQFGELA